jgi:6-phosphogluconate dehydrogenase (decarboxylating)
MNKAWLGDQYASLLDPRSTWFQRWYFELRVTEEIYRFQRYGQLASLIVMIFDANNSEKDYLASLAKIAEEGLRLVDVPGHIESSEYGICLPHTSASGADVVIERLTGLLSDFSVQFGYAVFGEDGETFWELLTAARRNATGSGRRPIPFHAA